MRRRSGGDARRATPHSVVVRCKHVSASWRRRWRRQGRSSGCPLAPTISGDIPDPARWNCLRCGSGLPRIVACRALCWSSRRARARRERSAARLGGAVEPPPVHDVLGGADWRARNADRGNLRGPQRLARRYEERRPLRRVLTASGDCETNLSLSLVYRLLADGACVGASGPTTDRAGASSSTACCAQAPFTRARAEASSSVSRSTPRAISMKLIPQTGKQVDDVEAASTPRDTPGATPSSREAPQATEAHRAVLARPHNRASASRIIIECRASRAALRRAFHRSCCRLPRSCAARV